MSAVAWLAKSLFESLTGLWPVAILALLGLIAPARVLWRASTDTRRATTRRAQKGWWFPLVLIVLGLLLSPFDTSAIRGLSVVTTAALLGIPLLHIAWMVIAVGRSRGARRVVLSTMAAQLCVDLLVFMPAMTLATGFGRTWK